MIYALLIVSEGDGERYLNPVLDRASRWSDGIYVALEPRAGLLERELADKWAGAYGYLKMSCDENDGMCKTNAWHDMSNALHPTVNDHVAVVKPTEVFQNPDAIRKAVKENPGYAFTGTVNHMWDMNHIRVDGSWAPKDEIVLIPWSRGASYPDFRLRAGRLPSYQFNLPSHGIPVTQVIDYDMMTFDDKLRKWNWFQTVDASGFYSPDHITSIKRHPKIRAWRDGGVLHVGENV